MSRHELYALRNQASADHGGTTTSAPGTGGQTERGAASNDASGNANGGKPADSSGTSQAENSAQEGGDATANATVPVHDAGSPISSGTLDAGVGNAAVDGSGDSGGEGQGVSTLAPDSDSDTEPGSEPEGVSGSGDRWPGPPGDVEPGPDPGTGIDGSRSHTDAGTAATQDGASGRHGTDNLHRAPGRIEGGQDTVTTGSRDQDEGKDAQRSSQADTDTSEPAQRAEGTTDGETAGGQGKDTPEQEPRDQSPVQPSSPDADVGPQIDTSSEAAPNQNPDDPRLTAMEQQIERMQVAFEAIQAKLDASEARHEGDKANLRQEIGGLKTENAELRQKVAELETVQQERQTTPVHSPDSGEQTGPGEMPDDANQEERRDLLSVSDDTDHADGSAVDSRLESEADRERDRTSPRPKRPVFSPEEVEFAKSAAGVLSAAGVTIPGADLVLGGDSTRRAMEKMPLEQQTRLTEMGDAIGIAFGSMSPGMAVAAIATSVIGPAMYTKARDMAQDFLHKIKRKD